MKGPIAAALDRRGHWPLRHSLALELTTSWRSLCGQTHKCSCWLRSSGTSPRTWIRDIGDLKAGLLLDYVLEEIAPSVYNQAIQDAQRYFQERANDLEGVCFEREFGYWKDARTSKR